MLQQKKKMTYLIVLIGLHLCRTMGKFLRSVNIFIKTAVDIAEGSSFQNFFLNSLLVIQLGN